MPSSPRQTPVSHLAGSPSCGPQRTGSPFALPGTRDGLSIAGVPDDAATPGDLGPSPESSISILPTSLPTYHKAFMSGAPPPSSAPAAPPSTTAPQSNSRRALRPI